MCIRDSIYLVALSIALLGPTTLALRLPAALVGTLTTLPAWLLGRAWFGRTVGLLAAFLWAITLWPVHLGRIGLRAGLLAPALALAFWLGTRAYRERRATPRLAARLALSLIHLSQPPRPDSSTYAAFSLKKKTKPGTIQTLPP